jgi:acetyltransferase-like isoleucine patch superfamily enzyme
VLVKSGAILTLEEYVHIYPGTYITVGNGAQLFIGSESVISNDSQINCRAGISIGAGSLIGAQTMLMDYDGHPIFHQDKPDLEETFGGEAKPIVIGKNVWVGFRSIILKGVTIGEGAIIGAGSCVTADVTSNTAVAGNPARVIKEGISWRRY